LLKIGDGQSSLDKYLIGTLEMINICKNIIVLWNYLSNY